MCNLFTFFFAIIINDTLIFPIKLCFEGSGGLILRYLIYTNVCRHLAVVTYNC